MIGKPFDGPGRRCRCFISYDKDFIRLPNRQARPVGQDLVGLVTRPAFSEPGEVRE